MVLSRAIGTYNSITLVSYSLDLQKENGRNRDTEVLRTASAIFSTKTLLYFIQERCTVLLYI